MPESRRRSTGISSGPSCRQATFPCRGSVPSGCRQHRTRSAIRRPAPAVRHRGSGATSCPGRDTGFPSGRSSSTAPCRRDIPPFRAAPSGYRSSGSRHACCPPRTTACRRRPSGSGAYAVCASPCVCGHPPDGLCHHRRTSGRRLPEGCAPPRSPACRGGVPIPTSLYRRRRCRRWP